MKEVFVKDVGGIKVITAKGEPDDITKAKFKSGDKVIASDGVQWPFDEAIATIDIPFLALVEERLTYAVIGNIRGKRKIVFYYENEMEFAEKEKIDEM